MEKLKKTLKSLGQLEGGLFRQVLVYSFTFPLLAILAQYDKFDLPYQALTELLAGTAGAAGILSAYLGSLRHPADEIQDLMNFKPNIWGWKAALLFGISAILFYTFYYFARQANQICLLFLCLGVFIFFYVLTNTVQTISKVEKQESLWKAMDSDLRKEWREEKARREEAEENNLQKAIQIHEGVQEIAARVHAYRREIRREIARERRHEFLKRLQHISYVLRSKINLLTKKERLEKEKKDRESEEWFYEKGWGWHKNSISQIAMGQSIRLYLEGTDLVIHEVGDWKYFLLRGKVDSNSAQKILAHMQSFEKDDEGKLKRVVALTDSSTEMSLETKKILCGTGVELVETPSDIHLTSQ